MSELQKTVIVTGAASDGIGVAILDRLVKDGFAVIGTFEPADAKTAARYAGASAVSLFEVDHGNRQAVADFVKRIPKDVQVAGLVNAQFYFDMEDPLDLSLSVWDRSLAVNLSTPLYLFRALRPHFAPGASVVTVTSTEAFVGSFGAPAYAATKAAIHNLTMSLANIAGDGDVRVNAVAAGWIGGVMDTDDVFNMSRKITPLGRLGSPEEIAAVAAFLLSSEASFVNGSIITADGGYSGVDTIAKYEFEADQAST